MKTKQASWERTPCSVTREAGCPPAGRLLKGYPLFLRIENQHCLVFGGGKVAVRKVQSLLRRGAEVECVSKDFSNAMKNLSRHNPALLLSRRPANAAPTARCRTTKRPTAARPIGGHPIMQDACRTARLVIAATSDREFNRRVGEECRKKKIWVNVVDDPEFCDFYVPAVLERGPLQVAISTGGASPLFAKRLREELEKAIPVSTGRLLEKLGTARAKWIREKRGRR